MERLRIGVIGCGMISEKYLENLTKTFAFCLDVRAVADIVPEAAQKRAEQFGVPVACSPEELIANAEIELVVNLTVPAAHYDVSMKALQAGKHVYTEKPLSVTREEGQRLLSTAQGKGLRVGGAPDTFLGGGLQTCRKIIDDGWIGTPVTAMGFTGMGVPMARYHTLGIGPLFDMGPYYITAMVNLLGPVQRVSASAQTPFVDRVDANPRSPWFGAEWKVETPLVVAATLDFPNSVNATLTATCELFGYNPRLEVWGTDGVLICNDPNMFDGAVTLRRRQEMREFSLAPDAGTEMPYTHGYAENSRGLGVADMAYAIRTGRAHRASGELVMHTLDVMSSILQSSEEGRHVQIQSAVTRPEPFAAGVGGNVLA